LTGDGRIYALKSAKMPVLRGARSRERGYGYLDLHTPFALEDGSMNPAFCKDTVHVNKEFHRIVALALRCTMLEMGWDATDLVP
jgi:hypothetical protein